MRKTAYAVGDHVTLITGIIRSDEGAKACRIVGLLPVKEDGERQYRVQLGDEKFERRITETDIEDTSQADASGPDGIHEQVAGGSWLKPASMRSGKPGTSGASARRNG